MLVVRIWGAISYALVHKFSKVEDATPNFEERFGQNRNSTAETTRKKLVSRAASKRAGSRTIIGIFERHRRGDGSNEGVEAKR